MFIYMEEIMDKETALALIKSGKLSDEQLVEVGLKSQYNDDGGITNNDGIWEAILLICKLPPEKIFELACKTRRPYVWQWIIDSGKLSSEQLLEAGKKSNIFYEIWKLIFESVELSGEQLLEVVKARSNWQLVIPIVESGKLSAEQLMKVGEISDYWEVWEAIAESGILSTEQLKISKKLKRKTHWRLFFTTK